MKDIPEELIIKASRGDHTAFEEIYRHSAGFVYSVAMRLLRSAAEAEDVTQEVFVRLYRNLKGFGFRSSFKTWLYRITMNTALNAYNKKVRETSRRADYDESADPAVSSGPVAGEGIDSEENELKLRSLLDMLTPEHRAVIILRELEGLSYEDMAKALNININTARTRLKRAREALMAQAGKEVTGHAM